MGVGKISLLEYELPFVAEVLVLRSEYPLYRPDCRETEDVPLLAAIIETASPAAGTVPNPLTCTMAMSVHLMSRPARKPRHVMPPSIE